MLEAGLVAHVTTPNIKTEMLPMQLHHGQLILSHTKPDQQSTAWTALLSYPMAAWSVAVTA